MNFEEQTSAHDVLHYLIGWPVQQKKAWSGTAEGLYRSLDEKTSVALQDVSGFRSDIRLVSDIMKALNGLSAQIINLKCGQRKINANPCITAGSPVFSFAEYQSRVVRDTYCYHDLTADYLLRMRQCRDPKEKFTPTRGVVPTFLLRYKQRQAREFYENCAGVFTMSEWLREDLIQNTGVPAHKVHHVGGGCNIDTALIDTGRKQGNRFLFVGKDWERKNGELVTKAFELLQKKYPEKAPELYVAGPAAMPTCLKGNEQIHYLGCLSYGELAQYYNLCDYFVMPSEFEAYGLVFVEALCFGLPCIGKNCFAMPEFISDGSNGYLIDQSDPLELSVAMEKLLINGASMANRVQSQRDAYIQKYSWSSVADRILAVMRGDGYQI